MSWKHLTFEDRKVISNGIATLQKAYEIAERIGVDPTAVSKEIKRNRYASKVAKEKKKCHCTKLDRYPYVCTGCKYKYDRCIFEQYSYDASIAQKRADKNLINTRTGINLTPEEAIVLTDAIKTGFAQKRRLIDILKETGIDISLPTAYRYIALGKIDIKKIDLPYATTYKKRKSNKMYDYSDNKIDRTNRTYLDFLVFMRSHIGILHTQMDFLGAIKQDRKSILTLIIVEIHFVLLFLVENKDSQKVVEIYDEIERKIGIKKFKEVFPVILTDRDPCFSNFIGTEFTKDTGEERTKLFFCDSYRSVQKASVENMNKQLRRHFPKGTSVDCYDQKDVTNIQNLLNESHLKSLDGYSPKEAFIKLFGEETYKKLIG